jgi:hypothetical protein
MKVPAGRVSDFHFAPPSVVASTTATSDELYPAARHSLLVGHEML